jgi:hypothetical protein
VTQPSQPNLDGVRIKLRRAYLHIQDLKKTLDPIMETANRPGNIIAEQGEDPSKPIYRVQRVPAIDPLCSAMVGDALFNMRSAFDHLAWQLVLLDGGTPCEYTKFPIYDSRTNQKGNPRNVTIQPQIQSPEILAALDSVQPYQQVKPQEDNLWGVNHLNNVDKHRLLLTMVTALNPGEIWWGLPPGVPSPEVRFKLKPLADGEVVAQFDFKGTPAPASLDPRISLAVTLTEGPHQFQIDPVDQMLEGVLHDLTYSIINWHFVRPLFGGREIDYRVRL